MNTETPYMKHLAETRQKRAGSACLVPVGYDKYGPMYAAEDLNAVLKTEIESGGPSAITRKAKIMANEVDAASEIVDESVKRFNESYNKLLELDNKFMADAKRISGSVRDSTQKLADGLTRIEKTANFDRLERLVGLLERADAALSSLAELEKSGKLERISASLK